MTVQRRVLDHLGIAGLVARRVRRIFGPIMEMDDLRQEAALALLHAASHFDGHPRVRFTTVAYRGCWRACAHAARKLLHRRSLVPMLSLNADDEQACGGLSDDPATLAVRPQAPTLKQLLGDAYQRLRARQHWLLERRYCRGWTKRQCASRLGVSRQRISQLESNALRRLAR